MLKVLRDNLKYLSWILWLVIIVFVLFVFVDFGRVNTGPGAAADTAARVGSQEVTFGELRRNLKNLEDLYRQTYGEQFTRELAEQLQLPRQALESLINQKVQLVEAAAMGLEVSDQELSARILEIPAFVDANGRFVGDETYRQRLRGGGYSVADFEKTVREELLLTKLTDILQQNIFVTDQAVEDAYREQVERAKLRYVLLTDSRFADQVEVSDEDIANYFEEHRAEYRLPERRRAAYLLVDQNRLRNEIQIDESELNAYYREHEDEFSSAEQVRARHILLSTNLRSREDAQRQMQEIRRRIEAGEDFGKVAGEVSEDPGSKDRGGELGFFGRGEMNPEFENAAFGAQVGDVVGPFDSPFGVHLVQVEDKREAGVRPFPEVRSLIQVRLASERLPAEAKKRIDELAAILAEDEPVLEAAPASETAGEGDTEAAPRQSSAMALRMKALAEARTDLIFAEPEPFSEGAVVPGLGRDTTFQVTVTELEPGSLSEPVQLNRGWALVYLDEVLEPRGQKLAEVEDRVREAIRRGKQKQMAVERMAEAKAQVDAGASLDEVAEGLGLTVEETTEFGPRNVVPGLGYNPQVVRAAFSLTEGEVGGPYESRQGAVLIEVTERTTMDPQAFELAREETRERLETEELNRLLSSIVRERRRQLEVRPSENLQLELDGASGQQG